MNVDDLRKIQDAISKCRMYDLVSIMAILAFMAIMAI